MAWLSEAAAGVPASLGVAWQQGTGINPHGSFQVGDELRVMPEAAARELADYRQAPFD